MAAMTPASLSLSLAVGKGGRLISIRQWMTGIPRWWAQARMWAALARAAEPPAFWTKKEWKSRRRRAV